MKKILLGIAFVFGAISAQATYLYWQINDAVTMGNTGTSYSLGQFTGDTKYEGAKFWAVGEAGAYELGTVNSSGQYQSLGTDLATKSTSTYVINLGDLAADYSYYVEYIGYNAATKNQGQIGISDTFTYQSLYNSGAVVSYDSSSLVPISQATVWHGGSSANAPEPTSAMLMLLGVAGLALRRKQRKIA